MKTKKRIFLFAIFAWLLLMPENGYSQKTYLLEKAKEIQAQREAEQREMRAREQELEYKERQAQIERDNYILPCVIGVGILAIFGIVFSMRKKSKDAIINNNNFAASKPLEASNSMEKFQQLQQLYSAGLISKEEYEVKKAELLKSM